MNATLQTPQISENTTPQQPAPEIRGEQRTLEPSIKLEPSDQIGLHRSLAVPPTANPPRSQPKTMDKGRYAFGLLLSFLGVSLLLFVAVGMMQQFGTDGWSSLPLVAFTAIAGLMMLSGGFVVMATAAASLDDGEYERLIEAGNISNVCNTNIT